MLAQDPDDQSALNQLLASGERLSALVVAHRLQEYGFDAYPLGAEDIGITLDGNYQANHVDLQHRVQTRPRFSDGTPVITGWFGEGKNNDIAILSRGGSDHSATAIAHSSMLIGSFYGRMSPVSSPSIRDGGFVQKPFLTWIIKKRLNYR